jgi:hypothetical protein
MSGTESHMVPVSGFVPNGTPVEAQWKDGSRWTDAFFAGVARGCDASGALDVMFDEDHGDTTPHAIPTVCHPHHL